MVPSPTRHARVRAHAGLVAARRYFAHYPGPPGPDFHAAERDLAAALRDLAHGDPLRDEVSFVLGAIRIADHEMRCANPCPAPDELVPIAGLLAAGGERPGAPAARLYPYAMTVDKLYDHTRDPAHIDLAITWLRAAAGHRDVSPGDRRRALLSLAIQHASKGAALRDSQGRSGPGTPSWAAFDAAIRQFEAVLAELDEHGGKSDPAIATDRLDTWLGLLETYYQRGGDQARDDDLDAMAALARNLISHLEPGYRLRSYALGRSGVLLMQRIMRRAGDGWDQALEAAMRSFQPTTIREVLTTVPGFEADLAAADDALAMAVGLENPASRWQPLFTAAACAVRGLRYLAHGGKENIQGFGRLCRIVMGYPDLDPVYRRSCSEFLLVVMVHQLADSGAELGLLRRSAAGLLPSGHEALDVMIGLLARFAAADGARMDPALSWALASAVNIRAAGELTDTELAASYARQCAAATAYANLPTVHAVLLAEAAITGAEWARRGTGPAGLTDQVAAAFSDALGSFPPSHPITIDLATRASKFAGDIPPDLGAFSPRVLASPGTASHGLVAASPGQAAEIARSALDPPPRKAERQAAVRSVLALALGTRWVRERNDEYLAEAISQLRWAIGLVRQRHPLHAPLTGLLAGMLLDRAWTRGDHADVDAALALLENQPTITAGPSLNVLLAQTGPPALRPLLSTGDVPSAGLTEAAIGSALLLRGLLSHSDGRDLSEAARLLAQVAAGLPADDPRRPGVLSDLGLALFAGDDTTGLRSGLDTLREALAACPAGHPQEPAIMLRVAAALAANAHAAYDPRIVDQSVELLRRALRSAGRDSYGERSRCLYSLGYTLLVRFSRGGQRTDLDAAIDALEESRAGLEPVPGDPFTVPVLRLLAWAHRRAGEAGSGTHRSLARSIGRSVLHARAETVLLQTRSRHGVAAARAAGQDAVRLAQWCLADGMTGSAVEALELGRALVLHEATVAGGVPALLREAGQPGLAREWAAAQWHEIDEVPSDLRHRVLVALRDGPAQRRLLSAPEVSEIAATLRASGTDALVYLVPGGYALIVHPDGQVRECRLPDLVTGPGSVLADFAAAHHEKQHQRFRALLGELCDWAWTAAVGPVLALIKAAAPPARLTIVGVGALGLVPWHAARHEVAGQYHYACHEAVFVSCASARQLIDATARRPAIGSGPAVLVTEPGGNLRWAGQETDAMASVFYPGAVTATDAEQILALLSAGDPPQVLHFGCHAWSADAPEQSRLELPGGDLTVDRILLRARARGPGSAAGLVVLAACDSDLTLTDYDEALTLTSAFLAAGAAGVVGSRWAVSDLYTALLMFMLHRHLVLNPRESPAAALRAAQLWMLDPHREAPAEMPEELAAQAHRMTASEPFAWAAFTYHGK